MWRGWCRLVSGLEEGGGGEDVRGVLGGRGRLAWGTWIDAVLAGALMVGELMLEKVLCLK